MASQLLTEDYNMEKENTMDIGNTEKANKMDDDNIIEQDNKMDDNIPEKDHNVIQSNSHLDEAPQVTIFIFMALPHII